jgi:hypothetical protein
MMLSYNQRSTGFPSRGDDFREYYPAIIPAVVVNIHWPDAPTNKQKRTIELDLITQEGSVLLNVPWSCYVHSTFTSADWVVPRAATRNIATGTLLARSESGNVRLEPGTTIADLDGDHVLVGFLQAMESRPVVIGRLMHPRSMQSGHPPRALEAPMEQEHHARTQGNCRTVANGGSKLLIDERGNMVLDARYIPFAGESLPDSVDVRQAPAGTVYVQARAGQRIVLAIEGRPDFNSLGYQDWQELPRSYADLESQQGDWPSGRTVVTVEAGKMTVALPEGGEFRVALDGDSSGGVASAQSVAEQLAKLRQDIARLHQYVLQPQANGKVYVGPAPSAGATASALSVKGMRVPSPSG